MKNWELAKVFLFHFFENKSNSHIPVLAQSFFTTLLNLYMFTTTVCLQQKQFSNVRPSIYKLQFQLPVETQAENR